MSIIDYLEEKGIDYYTRGKNVSQGWIGIQCLFCPDESNHLGIHLRSGKFKCWICGERGENCSRIIQEIEDCSEEEAYKIFKRVWEDDEAITPAIADFTPPSSSQLVSRVVLPPILNTWPEKYLNYITKRGFNSKQLIKKYKLMATHRFGEYRFRILAPFFYGQKLVTFTARDITGKQELKYKDCKIKHSVRAVKECLYNIDNVKTDRVVIVEGIFDCWRIGDGAVGLSTVTMTDAQLLMLLEKNVKYTLTLLDAGAEEEAERITRKLSTYFTTDIGYLEREDPDKMTSIDLLKVQRWLSY